MIIPALNLHAIAQYSALRMVDSLAEGSAILVFATLLSRVARKQNASTRFAIWFSALIAIALSPVITGVWSSQPGRSNALASYAVTVPESWAVSLFAAWVVVAGWLLLRVGRALSKLRVLRRSCTEIEVGVLDPVLQETLRLARDDRPVTLCSSNQVRVPTAVGLAKPVIVVPRWVMEELSTEELRQVFLHEMTHLRRRDDWTNLVQQVVRALFFFHPAVWWIEKNAALEREMACDDAVLAETKSPRAYAECLAYLAERSFARRSIALAQAVLGRVRQTSARVAKILEGNPRNGQLSWKPAASLVAGFAVVFSVCVSKMPRIIAFQNHVPVQAAQRGAPDRPPAASVQGLVPDLLRPASVHSNPPVLPTQAKFVNSPPARRAVHKPTPRFQIAVRPKTEMNGIFHLASSNADIVPYSQTVLLVIQGTEQADPVSGVSGIQMWRITVLHYSVVPSIYKAPRKQT